MNTEHEGVLSERAACAAVGALLGGVVGVGFEFLRIALGASSISISVVAVFGVVGAAIGALTGMAVANAFASLVSFFCGLMSAAAPEYWLVRERAPVSWERWVLCVFVAGLLVGLALLIL